MKSSTYEIKPIETTYKGYRFRSRLEARWAVFFDAAGVAWDYEPEGFDLGEDGWYLPDFRLLPWNALVEIKPRDADQAPVLNQLASLIDLGVVGHELAWGFFGDPADHHWMMPVKHNGKWRDEWAQGTAIEFSQEHGQTVYQPGFSLSQAMSVAKFLNHTANGMIADLGYKFLSRSARFEHGETAHA